MKRKITLIRRGNRKTRGVIAYYNANKAKSQKLFTI